MKLTSVRKTSLLSVAIAAALLATGCNNQADTEAAGENAAAQTGSSDVQLDSIEKQVTYIVGYNMAQQAKANGLTFDKTVMAQAIQDVQEEKDPRIEQAEQQRIMMSFQEQQQSKRESEMQAAAEKNQQESQTFLAENAKKEGVQTTESGLQYKVLSEGQEGGASPTADDVVKVHYHGTLPDGSVFDSSVERGQPVSFPVKGVIPGWVEALQLMSVGDKFQLVIPPELAYGSSGTSGKIGPNQALVFDVELLEINPEIEGHGAHSSQPAAEGGDAAAAGAEAEGQAQAE